MPTAAICTRPWREPVMPWPWLRSAAERVTGRGWRSWWARATTAAAVTGPLASSSRGERVAALVGPGNSGGDGYVAAPVLLERGAGVTLFRLGEPRSPDAVRAAASARLAGVPIRPLGEPEPADLVIDALFGGGGRPDLPEAVGAWARHEAPIIAEIGRAHV